MHYCALSGMMAPRQRTDRRWEWIAIIIIINNSDSTYEGRDFKVERENLQKIICGQCTTRDRRGQDSAPRCGIHSAGSSPLSPIPSSPGAEQRMDDDLAAPGERGVPPFLISSWILLRGQIPLLDAHGGPTYKRKGKGARCGSPFSIGLMLLDRRAGVALVSCLPIATGSMPVGHDCRFSLSLSPDGSG